MSPKEPAVAQLVQALTALLDTPRDDLPSVTAHARYVTVALASKLIGLTEKAIRRKIEDGVWLENREWRRAPDGHILIDMKGYEQWAEKAAG